MYRKALLGDHIILIADLSVYRKCPDKPLFFLASSVSNHQVREYYVDIQGHVYSKSSLNNELKSLNQLLSSNKFVSRVRINKKFYSLKYLIAKNFFKGVKFKPQQVGFLDHNKRNLSPGNLYIDLTPKPVDRTITAPKRQ